MLGGVSFLFKFWREDGFGKVLSRKFVSFWVCTRKKIAFLFLPFSLERKRKKQGEPTNGSPLTPFQRSTGTLSPSIAPAQGEGVDVSHQAVVRTAPRGRRSTAALLLYWSCAGRISRFSANFWFEIGGRKCGERALFLIKFWLGIGGRRCGEGFSFLVKHLNKDKLWKALGGERANVQNGKLFRLTGRLHRCIIYQTRNVDHGGRETECPKSALGKANPSKAP